MIASLRKYNEVALVHGSLGIGMACATLGDMASARAESFPDPQPMVAW
jgi:hypothetical protein